MASTSRTIDEYLSGLPDDQRTALQKLRRAIRSAAPNASECISYGVPAFRLDGRPLVAFGAAARHCAFYPGAFPIVACANDLSAYDTSKGTVRFQAATPLPVGLVRRLVKARIAEYARSRQARARARPTARK